MRFKKIIRLFKNGNVCVCGLRGKGKDLLIGNVIARRKQPYVSNLNYGYEYIPLRLCDLDIKNKYTNFINNDVNKYDYPYPLKADIYVSDCGVYLPSQYCNQLNRDFEGLISFQALSRHIARCNIHFNAQNLNRVWDKVREQSDIYIRCVKCIYLFGLVIQKVIIYDKYESCLNRINPCKIKKPMFASKKVKQDVDLYLDNFYNIHGSVKSHWLIYINKSKHDSYAFGKLLNKEVIHL